MTLYSQVQKYILDRIRNGTWQLGDQIPTEMELAAQLGVSRPTVRQAMMKLTEQGYLTRIKGRGSFVTQSKLLHRSTSMLSSYRQESEALGLKIETEVVSLTERRAGEEIADYLQIKPSAKVGVLTRLRRVEDYNEGRPVVLSTLYVPLTRLPDFMEHDFAAESFYELLAQRGLSVERASRTLDVVQPSAEDAELLVLGAFEPAIRIQSIGATEKSVPIEFSESLYPAGCSRFLIELNC